MDGLPKIYLTKQGVQRIKEEYENLLKIRKAKLRKEDINLLHSDEFNAEFVAFHEDFDILEARIEELEHIIKNFEIIKMPAKKDRTAIKLGAQVLVEVDGQDDEFMIVGTLEANPSAGKISDESPVGKALIDRKVGDEVTINSPAHIETIFKIKKIKYN